MTAPTRGETFPGSLTHLREISTASSINCLSVSLFPFSLSRSSAIINLPLSFILALTRESYEVSFNARLIETRPR